MPLSPRSHYVIKKNKRFAEIIGVNLSEFILHFKYNLEKKLDIC